MGRAILTGAETRSALGGTVMMTEMQNLPRSVTLRPVDDTNREAMSLWQWRQARNGSSTGWPTR